MNIFTFDIETIPDVDAGRKLFDLTGTDEEVAEAMFAKRKEETGSDFLPLHLHRICAISAVLKTPNNINVLTLGDIDSDEQEIVRQFFKGIDKYKPTLVSWNGSGFDLPVLHYRSLLHGIVAETYWEIGDHDSAYRWNNYINRYHYRHTDVMDVLACYQARANAKLDEVAVMLNLPGKMGKSGGHVWDSYKTGHLKEIRDYCETDVLNTHLIYLRFCYIQGKLTSQEYEAQCQEIHTFLMDSGKDHLLEFAKEWKSPKT